VVDNRAGGGGTIGTETAVKAGPDGYTMIIVSAAYTANAALYRLRRTRYPAAGAR
jgi:tripartite-type tricarboxylate transporter receptor subunit TctC